MRNSVNCFVFLAYTLSALAVWGETGEDRHYSFGKIRIDTPVEHTFTIPNTTDAELEIQDVSLTAPLIVTAMPRKIKAGETGKVTVSMEAKGRKYGEYNGFVAVKFAGGKAPPVNFLFTGAIVAPVTFEPFAAFFVSTKRGVPKDATIDIVNNEQEPLRIIGVEHSSTRFSTELETVEEGRRFRLKLALNGQTSGRAMEKITVVTDRREKPFMEVVANTLVNDRVHAFPDVLDLGTIGTARLKAQPNMVAYLAQSLMIYQDEGSDFRVSAESDVPFLRLELKQANLRDRAEIRVAIIPEQLKAGEHKGSIVVTTNDPDIPKLTIPVTVAVDSNW